MPHTHRKRKEQERRKHPKFYTPAPERMRPDILADVLLMAIDENSLTIEEFKRVSKEVIKRYYDKKNKTK